MATFQLTYDWGAIVGQLLRGAPDGRPYKLAAMYVEFENNGGIAVTPPTIDRADGLQYYADLSGSAHRDYIRVPMSYMQFDSTDPTLFPLGNRITCYAHTDGNVGVHGKPFTSGASSRIYGGALVACPDYDTPASDIVMARLYWTASGDQIIKPVGRHVGLEWPVAFE